MIVARVEDQQRLPAVMDGPPKNQWIIRVDMEILQNYPGLNWWNSKGLSDGHDLIILSAHLSSDMPTKLRPEFCLLLVIKIPNNSIESAELLKKEMEFCFHLWKDQKSVQ